MTTGGWLTRIGRAITRHETFERTIAPAIADMQMEAPRGRLLQWRHYIGIIAVLIHALCHDLRIELNFTFDAEARRAAWKRAALWYVGFVALLTGLGWRYNLPPNLALRQLWIPALTSTGLEAVIAAVIPAALAATLYLTRKSCSRRSVIIVALLVAALTMTFAMSVRPLRMSADRALLYSRGIFSTPNPYEDHFDPGVTWWKDVQVGVEVIPFGLLGMLLARRKGWDVALGIAAYYSSWLLLVILVVDKFRSFPPSPVVQIWREILLNFLALVVVFLVDRISRRFRSELRIT